MECVYHDMDSLYPERFPDGSIKHLRCKCGNVIVGIETETDSIRNFDNEPRKKISEIFNRITLNEKIELKNLENQKQKQENLKKLNQNNLDNFCYECKKPLKLIDKEKGIYECEHIRVG